LRALADDDDLDSLRGDDEAMMPTPLLLFTVALEG
jgi:hypothetical protein